MLLNDPAADPEPQKALYTPEGWDMRPRARLLGSRPAGCCSPAGWLWASDLTSLCLNQWPTGRAQEHTSGRVARFWAAPCGLWGLLMALQLGRGPGQRWMEEAGRRPRSTRSGLGRWMGKKGQQPGTFSGSTSSQVHVQVPRKAPFTNRCGAAGRTAASIRCLPQAREQVGSGRAGLLQNCGGDHVVCRAGSGESRCRATFPSAMPKALPGRGQVSGQGFA